MVGDRLLMAVGQRLAGRLRPGDTVARFGGDEFGVILDPVADESEAVQMAEGLAAELRAPFTQGGREWFISASIGIAVGDADRVTPEELLREAEIAMVRAKEDPANRVLLFEPTMSAAMLERIDLENDLRSALVRGELRCHYQPIVDLHDGRIVGFEALVRWQHPTRGLIPPLSFIPMAEETGLIVPLGRWVLETACRQAVAWRSKTTGAPLVMSVNLSARQFVQAELVDEVQRHPDDDRPRARRARARDHRIGPDGPVRERGPDAPSPARARRPARPRRLRDRLLVAVLPQAPAARHDQDRPLVRRRPRRQGGPLDRRGRRRARPRPWHRGGRRGHRDRDAAPPAHRARLRSRPGLPVLAARARNRSDAAVEAAPHAACRSPASPG